MTIEQRAKDIKEQGLWRDFFKLDSPQGERIVIEEKSYLNFSSNNYLGLANHPQVSEALREALKDWGYSSGASRYVSGNLRVHSEAEEAFAAMMNTQAALFFSTGYMANIGVITALAQENDLIFMDRLCHASIVDAVKLSGAKWIPYKHNDVQDLHKKIQRYRGEGQAFLITEALFSMDGDYADLKQILPLAKQEGLISIVDEAHSWGTLGPSGRGYVAQCALEDDVDLRVVTLGKAAAFPGAFAAGSQQLMDLVRNRARTSIYTTALPPFLLAAFPKVLDIIKKADALRKQLQKNWCLLEDFGAQSPIVPVILGSNEKALFAAEQLRDKGFWVSAMRYPTVKKGTERLRLSLSAGHKSNDILALKAALGCTQTPI